MRHQAKQYQQRTLEEYFNMQDTQYIEYLNKVLTKVKADTKMSEDLRTAIIEAINLDIKKHTDGGLLAETYPTFDDFWLAYKKAADKPRAERLWKKLNQKTKEKIMLHVPEYVLSTPNKEYRKNPATYLNNKGWENEIIIGKTQHIEDSWTQPLPIPPNHNK